MTKKRGRARKATAGETRRHAEEKAKSAAPADAGPRIPLWVPATLFLLLTAWLFRAFIFSDKMLYGGDTLSLGYVARAFYAHSLKSFTFPRWNPQILGGTPFLEALTGGDSLYPPSALLLLLLEPYRALGWKLVVHIAAAGFFMFGWMRALKASRAAALVAGVGYTLSPFLVSWVYPGHDGKIFVTALAPLLFWATERFFVRPGAKSFAGIGLVVALVILTTHFEMAYFLFGGVGLYAIFRSVQVWRGTGVTDDAGVAASGTAVASGETASAEDSKEAVGAVSRRRLAATGRLGLFIAAAVVGAAAAGVQLIPAAHYVTHYSRRIQTTQQTAGMTGRAWSSSYSMHPEEALGQIIPEFDGNNSNGSAWSSGTYWGRNGFRTNTTYAGLVLLILSAVAFVGGRRRGVRWFFAGLGTLALLFSLGTHTPVWGIFYALVPGIRMFRAPEQAMLLFAVAIPTLGGLGIDRVLQVAHDDDEAAWGSILRVLWIASGILVVLALLAGSGALTSFWTSVIYRDIGERQLQALATLEPFIVRGAFIAAVLAICASALAWAVRRHYLAPTALIAGLVVLVVVDEARIDGSFIQVMDFQDFATPDPNIKALLDREKDDPEPYRLLDFQDKAQDDLPAMFGIELAAGHHPNDLARYRELIGMVGSELPT
ncbi:MAG: YfhO family protein, partial [Gemmatimonadetes bacterium]|nr:YfhO family protein [Gemmatimonadota bacterium]